MINWWLILIAVLLSLLVLFLSIYFVVIFVSEADAGLAYVPKIVCVLGMMLACLTVLLLPFDVAARTDPTAFSKFSTDINTETLWQAMLWIDAGFVLVIIPFATFYYEAMDPDKPDIVDQIAPAVGYTLAINAIFFILCGVLWYFKGYANLPYLSYTGIAQFKGPLDTSLQYVDLTTSSKMRLRVSFFVYVVALLCFFGWILFLFYGGAGLVAFPYDFILDFKYRPRPMKKQDFDQEVLAIANRAKQMQEAGKKLDKDQRANNNNSVRNRINLFRSEVLILEERLDKAIVSYQEQGGSPFVIFGKLLLGIVGIGLTVMWILQIIINNIVKAHPLLNTLFIALDNAFALLGVIAYSIFAFYLLWASIKGCVKIGMRIVFFTIHPMKLGDTLMNALLFNVGLILITSITVVQFCSQSFSTYAVGTAVDMLIGLYVRRLEGIGDIIYYFQYALLAMIGLSVLWIFLCPRKKPPKDKKGELRM